jgi:carbonic anhydrase
MRTMNAETVWEKMLGGNRRYAAELPPQADICAQRRRDTVAGQHPCAAVVACSDSRVPVEHLFDMGVGDLFVVRVAGNVMGIHEAGSLEYALEHLHVQLLLILGHTGCSAVNAALSGYAADGAIGAIVKKITPAADRARAQNLGASDVELMRAACIENVHQAMSDLFTLSPAVKAATANGTATVAGALYDIETGEVVGLNA